MAQGTPGPSGAKPKTPAKPGAAAEPTLVEHYAGRGFASNVRKAFDTVEPVLVAILVAFALSFLYPVYEEATDKMSYFKTTPWLDAPDPRALEGVYAVNDALTGAEHLFEGKIFGPESFAEHGNVLLASTLAGTVVEVPRSGQGDPRPVFFTPAAVDGLDETKEHPLFSWCQEQAAAANLTAQHTCGRPLGMRVRGDDLYVLDAYFGLFRKSLASAGGTAEWLVRPEDCGAAEQAGRRKPPALSEALTGPVKAHVGPCRAFDDLDVLTDGSAVFTDASGLHPIRHFMMAMTNGAGDGRLFMYNATTKETTTIAKGARAESAQNLQFPNGVQLTPEKDAVLFTETSRRRITRCKLPVGPEGCVLEAFDNNLPGFPDNLRASADGKTVLVALAGKCAKPLCVHHTVSTHPQLARLANAIFGKVLFGSVEAAEAAVRRLTPRYGLVAQMAWDGRVVRTLHDPTGRTPMISELHESDDGFVYLGSPMNKFVGRVPAKAFRGGGGAAAGGGEEGGGKDEL